MSALKLIGAPGTLTFIVCCVLISVFVAYVWPRSSRLARGWLWFVFAGHVTLSVPLVANGIAGALPPVTVTDAAAAHGIDTVFMLDGDNRMGRVYSAARAATASPSSTVHILGGHFYLIEALEAEGVAKSRITHDFRPEDTRQQLSLMQELSSSTSRTALIASRLQMPRVAALVQVSGLQTMLIASPVDAEPPTAGFWVLVPTYYALRVSRDAIYELAALKYYAWRGWIEKKTSG